MKTIKLNSSGFSHHLVIALIAIVFVAGFGAYKVFYSKAATTVVPCCLEGPTSGGAVVVLNTGYPDITVKTGEYKKTGNNPNSFKRYSTSGDAPHFQYCGFYPITYPKTSIFVKNSSGQMVQKYPNSTGSVATIGSASNTDMKEYCTTYTLTTTVNLCYKYTEIKFKYAVNKYEVVTASGYVKLCTLLNTEVDNYPKG